MIANQTFRRSACFFGALLFACSVPVPGFAATFSLLHEFRGKPDGAVPVGGLVMDASGNLFGVTSAGGAAKEGTVFMVSPAGAETVLHSFRGGTGDGAKPESGVVIDSAGNLYGTTTAGGTGCSPDGCGTVYELADSGGNYTFKLLYAFQGGTDGQGPVGGLARDGAGNLYGTTESGGNRNCACGTVFKLSAAGSHSLLHAFAGGRGDGATPTSRIVRDSSGNLFGTTIAGGAGASGTLFKVAANGAESLAYSFCSQAGCADGAEPYGDLALSKSTGNLLGTAFLGGDFATSPCAQQGCGTVYEVEPEGQEITVLAFDGQSYGAFPLGGATLDQDANIYSSACGNLQSCEGIVPGQHCARGCNKGSVFKNASPESPDSFVLLHAFRGTDGSQPSGRLLLESGTLYGTTAHGGLCGNPGCGVLFKIVP